MMPITMGMLAFSGSVAPTYFASSSLPADNGSDSTAQLTVTPPASMTAGDLVVVVCQQRATSGGGWVNGVTGGQTWNALATFESGFFPECRIFWCTFNGTWGASPRFDYSGSLCSTVVMHVFRPDNTSRAWAIDTDQASAAYTAPSTPFTVSRAGLTTVSESTVTLAVWTSIDDNTWNTLTGTGWVTTGTAQYRNTAGSDQSCTFAHYLAAAAGEVVPTATKNQATLGGDAGMTAIVSWKFA